MRAHYCIRDRLIEAFAPEHQVERNTTTPGLHFGQHCATALFRCYVEREAPTPTHVPTSCLRTHSATHRSREVCQQHNRHRDNHHRRTAVQHNTQDLHRAIVALLWVQLQLRKGHPQLAAGWRTRHHVRHIGASRNFFKMYTPHARKLLRKHDLQNQMFHAAHASLVRDLPRHRPVNVNDGRLVAETQ